MAAPHTPHDAFRRATRLLLGAFLAWLYLTAAGKSETPSVESQVKAAFLYKFASYVEWPPQSFERPDSPLVIGVVEAGDFAQVLEQTIAGRGINGRPVLVQRLARNEAPRGVHILFIPREEAEGMAGELAASKGLAVLTVTDADNGLGSGCMINFVVDNNRVRFDIAPEAAELNRLKISARLMSVARRVVGKTS